VKPEVENRGVVRYAPNCAWLFRSGRTLSIAREKTSNLWSALPRMPVFVIDFGRDDEAKEEGTWVE
jgi:hypothetical protein